MSKANSAFSPRVRDGLCRHVRAKGMIVNMGEDSNKDTSFKSQYLAADRNALPYDTTIWWCTETSKTVGPDDRPCDNQRCKSGRSCYQAESSDDIS